MPCCGIRQVTLGVEGLPVAPAITLEHAACTRESGSTYVACAMLGQDAVCLMLCCPGRVSLRQRCRDVFLAPRETINIPVTGVCGILLGIHGPRVPNLRDRNQTVSGDSTSLTPRQRHSIFLIFTPLTPKKVLRVSILLTGTHPTAGVCSFSFRGAIFSDRLSSSIERLLA